jgi:glycosyltransferase involved in cell wall biosynthesis
MITGFTEVSVVVPARNEAETLPACVGSIRTACARLVRRHPRTRTRLIIVLDRCTDDSRAVLSPHRQIEVVDSAAGTAGGARALGAAHALNGRIGSPRIWLANTDADSCVPPDWLEAMVGFAEAGAAVVLGTVQPDGCLDPETRARWQARHDLVEDHRHIHGANFGIRADVYRALGGWTTVTSGEDVALAARAEQAGVPVRRTALIPVTTSSRLVGRAPDGFANYLAGVSELSA